LKFKRLYISCYSVFSFSLGSDEQQDDIKSISSLTKAISLKPTECKYYIKRGEKFLQLCDFQSAILNYKKACILDPDNDQYYSRLASIYYMKGQCLFDCKNYTDALECFSRAAEMKPDVIGYHTRRYIFQRLPIHTSPTA
jgi:tetratricopeptide (TPR) repeat protein